MPSVHTRVVNLAKQTVQFQGNGNNDFQFSLGPMECYDMLGPAFDSNNFFYLNSLNGSETGYIGLNWETSNSVGVPIVQPMYGSNCCGGARTRWWIMVSFWRKAGERDGRSLFVRCR